MRIFRRIFKFIKIYQVGIIKIARKISKEKKMGLKDAIKELSVAKEFNCGCHEYYEKGIYKLRPKFKTKNLRKIDRQYIVSKISGETGRKIKEINNIINYLNKKYYIDYKEYYNKKYYLFSKEKCVKKIIRDRKITAVDIAEKMNIKIDDALERLERVCTDLEISHNVYFNKKYYKLHEMDILTQLPWKKEYLYELANIVVDETGKTYSEVVKRMIYIKNKYNVLYSTYVMKMYYMLTEEEIVKDLNDYIQIVSNETGWTYNEALFHMNKLKKKYNISFSRYCYCRYYSVEEEAYKLELEYKDDRYNSIVEYARELGVGIRTLYEAMRLHCIRYGDPEDYYISKNFYSIKKDVLSGFLHGRDGDYILPRKYNTEEGYELLFNKVKFNEVFDKQLGRKWWINSSENSLESFVEFTKNLDEIFVKPMESSRGRGCRKIKLIEGAEETIYNELMASKEKLLVEECIKPHEVIKQFGGGSVSSIRAIVLYTENKTNILSAYLRVGNGEITDNISVDGVAIEIDINTGITTSFGINKNGEVFENDQFSGVNFKGVQIPYWREAINLIEDVMCKLDGKVGYAGLDIAITEKGPVLIEANSHAHLHRIEFFKNNKFGNRYILEKFL